MNHIVIIGNGIAGITAAREIRKRSNARITVVSSESQHFYSRTALMYIYMGQLTYEHTKPYEDWFWKKNNIHLVFDHVYQLNSTSKSLYLQSGERLSYDTLILACGSKPTIRNWKGSDLQGVQGFYSLHDLECLMNNSLGTRRAVVAGGGLIGIELVEMFHSRGIPVTFLVRELKYWHSVLPHEEATIITRHIKEHGVDLRLQTELMEIHDDGSGRVGAVTLSTGERIPTDLLAIAIGVTPNIDWLLDSGLTIERGIVVNDYFQTSSPDIYAIGDCAEICFPGGITRVEQYWYAARRHGEIVAETVCGNPRHYHPAVFFNSAKLWDIEYQVYGSAQNNAPDERTIIWIHPDGRHSIRLVYKQSEDLPFIGCTTLGIRYDHRTCERWIMEQRSIEYVLEHLSETNCDPEFFPRFESELVAEYNRQTGRNVQLQSKKTHWLRRKKLS